MTWQLRVRALLLSQEAWTAGELFLLVEDMIPLAGAARQHRSKYRTVTSRIAENPTSLRWEIFKSVLCRLSVELTPKPSKRVGLSTLTKARGIPNPCLLCGKPFIAQRIAHGRTLYCSHQCCNAARKPTNVVRLRCAA